MKFKLFLAAALTTLLASFANAVPNQLILGNWRTYQPIMHPGVTFNLHFRFDYHTVEVTTRCRFHDGARLAASARSHVHYNVNQIQILNRHETVSQDGRHFCRASLDYGFWTAYFDGTGVMYLTLPAPYQQIVLVRH